MSKTVVLVGSLDTKGEEYAYVKELIEKEGLNTLVVDFGVMGAPFFAPDISREEVAAAAGVDMAHLASGDHKDEAMQVMADGLAVVVNASMMKANWTASWAWAAAAAPPSPPRPCARCRWACPR